MTTLYDVVVKNRHVEGGNIAVMEFESATSAALPKVEPGAHIDVHLPNGMVRQYSLCQNPNDEGKFRLGILRDPESRGGSISAFDEIKDGMQIQVSEPKNLFPLLKAKHSVLIGGGIGITPLITMAYQLAHEGASFELHYCGASHRAFFESAIKDIDPESHIYTCGPVGFMDWVINLATTHDFPEQQIHKEYFQVETDTSGDSFEVVAERSGKIIMVEAGETILQALAKEGIEIEMSCEQGVCGTCMCDVIEGEPDHRDVYFTDEEKASNEQILVCCSRSKTPRLVLDI